MEFKVSQGTKKAEHFKPTHLKRLVSNLGVLIC